MQTLLITGAGGVAASNFISCLDSSYTTVGADKNPYFLHASSTHKKYSVPPSTDNNYVSKLNEIIEQEHVDFLHCQPDIDVRIVSEQRKKVTTKTFLPSPESIVLCQNKNALITHLHKHNIPVPHSIPLIQESDIDRAFSEISGTVWLRASQGYGSRASLPVKTPEQAHFWIDYWAKEKGVGYGQFQASEFLPGKNYAWFSLWKDGELITSQARERVELLMANITVSGVTSTPSIARTVSIPAVNEAGTAAVQTVDTNPNGLYCVDMVSDAQDKPRVTEINAGRFFTTVPSFFAEAGLNIVELYLKTARGESVEVSQYNPLPENVYWIRVLDRKPVLWRK